MEQNKYLSSGEKLGGHYEIVEVLGEDDFEILYLVKDRHLKDKLFVLKEFFSNGISLRDTDGTVFSPAKSKYVFDNTKKEIIVETKRFQESNQNQEIETYGYFEENNTVYIIMEFKNNSNIDSYLQSKSQKKEEIEIPFSSLEKKELKVSVETTQKSRKFPKFLIGLIFLLMIFSGLAYYAFKIIKEDKNKSKDKPSTTIVEIIPVIPKPMNHPTLTTRDNRTKNIATDMVKTLERNETNLPLDKQVSVSSDNVAYIDPSSQEYIEKNISNLQGVPKDEIYVDNQSNMINLNHGNIDELRENGFNQKSVGIFLSRFTEALSNGSVDYILSFYDTQVQNYFKLIRVTHQEIRKDRDRYNAQWKYRDFRIESFSIIKTYTEHGIDYCDISVGTKWSVSTKNLKSDLGESMGSITLKKTANGFKIKSIR